MRVAIVIPGHNEAKYIARVLKKTRKYSQLIIYVDDGSTDSSLTIAKRYTPHTLHHSINLGKGAAMKTGAEYAFGTLGAAAVIFMDADDQHDPAEIPHFESKLRKADVVFGVRGIGTSMPMVRYLGNKFASVMLNVLFGGYVEDIPSGYKAIKKSAYAHVRWKSVGYEVETEIAARVLKNHVRFSSVPIEVVYHDNDKGMTILDAFHIATCLVQWRVGL